MISVSSYAHISDLLELKALEAIFSILDIYDPDLLGLLLEMVEELLKFGELVGEKDGFLENKGNEVIMEIEKLGGVKKIENLLEHNNQKINEKAKYLLSFFETFEEI